MPNVFPLLDRLAYCPQAAREDESSPLRWGEATFMWWDKSCLSSLGTGRAKGGGHKVSGPSLKPGHWLNPKAGFFSQMSFYFDLSVKLKKSREACSFK